MTDNDNPDEYPSEDELPDDPLTADDIDPSDVSFSDREKITLHQRYKQGELPEDVAEVLIGDSLEEIEREREAFEEAAELDMSGVYQDDVDED